MKGPIIHVFAVESLNTYPVEDYRLGVGLGDNKVLGTRRLFNSLLKVYK
jgi:hypothetical protein